MTKEVLDIIESYREEGYEIITITSCKNYTRVSTNHGVIHIHH